MWNSRYALGGAILIAAAGWLPFAASAQEASSEPAGEAEAQEVNGEALYLANCRMCHGNSGTAGTPLAGNEDLADAGHVARTIIIGPGYMTAFGDILSDQEIAAIATHVRTSWGNDFGPVTPEEVAAAR